MRVAYGRVSTQEQADVGALERQERALLAACKPDELLLDVGSGTTTNRRGYQRLLQLIQSGQVEQVLVKEQDRLNRNLQADLELWDLCAANGTKITDLHGREIEFRTPDGNLLSTVVSALNQHRSKSYALKTRQGLELSRKEGMPAVASVPFGIKKVFEGRQLVALEVDPERRPYAQERVEKFLELKTLNATVNWINQNHPDGCKVEVSSLRRWLTHPNLTGRLCHTRDKKTEEFAYVAPEQSFEAVISDVIAERVSQLVAATRTRKALAGRAARPLTGLCRCADCGTTVVYKKNPNGRLYLRCGNAKCRVAYKTIREELAQVAVAVALQAAAKGLAKVLNRPQQDPPAVVQLKDEIKKLEGLVMAGLEEVIAGKKRQVAQLRASKSKTSPEAVALAVTHPKVWLQSDEWLNQFLGTFIEGITLKLAETTSDSRVAAIEFKPEVECTSLDPSHGSNDNYVVMLLMQELAVANNYQGWNWEHLSTSYMPALREQARAHKEAGGELADSIASYLHGRHVHLKKIEPRLKELWPEL